jgi:hypothetical protein
MGDRFEIIPLSAIEPDSHNANKGSERGTYMIRRSLEKLGAGRSILLDSKGRIIAGNKTAESAADVGIDEVVLVRTRGNQLVAVMREDLDLDDPNGDARQLAYADNRTGVVSYTPDIGVLTDDIGAGVDLSDWFKPFELSMLTGNYERTDDPNELWKGMPEFDNPEALGAILTVKVHFASSDAVEEFAHFVGQNITNKTTFIWYPKREDVDLKRYSVQDES